MPIVAEASAESDEKRQADGFQIAVGGVDLEFQAMSVHQAKLSGRDVVAAGGFPPGEDYIVLHWRASGELEDVDLDGRIDLRADGVKRFIVAKSDREFVFELEGKPERWPVHLINSATLKRLAGKSADEVVVVIERPGEPDEEASNDAMIDLGAPQVERFRFRPSEKEVEILVNRQPVRMTSGLHTGLDIKQAAIKQRVKIQLDFLLYLVKLSGETDRIDDNEPVKVERGQHYDAIDDDDNS